MAAGIDLLDDWRKHAVRTQRVREDAIALRRSRASDVQHEWLRSAADVPRFVA